MRASFTRVERATQSRIEKAEENHEYNIVYNLAYTLLPCRPAVFSPPFLFDPTTPLSMTASPHRLASTRSRRLAPALSLLFSAVAALVSARADSVSASSSNGASAGAGTDETVVTLEKFVASAKANDIYDVLPDRDSSSVFGTSRSLQDTPRSVTLVESALTDLYSIRTVNDFVAITAGSFTGNYFGVPGALDVRGERADNFFRGFRRVENRGNFPTPIAGTDFVEIIKGPPPPIYGGGKIGGILNFIPKTAKSKTAKFIDKPVGIVSTTVGTYGKKMGSVEYGTPFTVFGKRSGAYAFFQDEDSHSYYANIYNRDKLAQLAIDTELSDSVLLEYGAMVQWSNLNQSLGWNRVTQQMIDSDGLYLAGKPALNLDTNHDGFLSPSEVNAYQLTQFAFANPFPVGALTPQQAAAYALDPTTVHLVKLSHHTVQAETLDFSKTDAVTGFFDITKTWNDALSLKNQSFYDSMNHTKYSSYGFTADYVDVVAENKTTLDYKIEPAKGTVIDNVFGESFRFTDGDERESRGRGYQVLDRRDLSVGPTGNDRFEGAYTGTGDVPYNWRQIGDSYDFGVFGLIDTTFANKIGLILSGRWDAYHAKTNGTDLNGVFAVVRAHESKFTYNASLSYKSDTGLTPYVTYAESNYVELGQGGMIDRLNLGGNTWIQPSKLAEAGVKGTLLHNKLYVTLDYYEQQKTSFDNQAGIFDKYKSHGVELETRFAPTKTLSFTGAATWQKTILRNSPFFLGVPPSALGLDPAKSYGGLYIADGSLIGVPNNRETPTPREVFSVGGTYTDPAGWGGMLGGTYVSSMWAGYLEQIRLPSYFVTRAALFYNTGHWSYRLNGTNLLNAKYYTPQFLFWDTFISPSEGPTGDFTVTYKW